MRRQLLVSLSALLAACVATAALATAGYAASEDRAVVDTTPYVQLIQDPCTGEFVLLTGEVHGVHRLAFDETGVFVHRVEVNVLHVEGVGTTTGTRYRINWPTPMTNNSVSASEGSAVSQFVLIAPGPDNNVRSFLVGHFTFDPSGDQTAAVFHVDSATCQGG
jgi:hypothetical protein